MSDNIWQLRNLWLHSRVKAVNLDIGQGIIGVVGASGSGKTSLLNLLVGFETGSGGEVIFADESGEMFEGCRLPMYWVPSDDGLWPHMSVAEHIGAVSSGMAFDEVDVLLRSFDLAEQAGQKPHELSRGQQSRLSVLRAIASDAKILVMDEPLSHLDDELLGDCWGVLMSHLRDKDRTLVFASHDRDLVMAVCDRVIKVEDGCAEYLDDVLDVRRMGIGAVLKKIKDEAAGVLAVVLLLFVMFVMLGMQGCGEAEGGIKVAEFDAVMMPPIDRTVPRPRKVSIDDRGRVLALDTSGRVTVFDDEMGLVDSWMLPSNREGNAEGICHLRDGRIAVADTHYSQVLFYDKDHKLVSKIGGEINDKKHYEETGNFHYPVSIVQDDKGFLYVAEFGGGDRIQKFTEAGKFVKQFGRLGSGDGELARASGMKWYKGHIYIADAENHRIMLFTDEGEFVKVFAGGKGQPVVLMPYDIDITDDGIVYVIEWQENRVACFDLEGRLLGRYGMTGGGIGEFKRPWSIAVDKKGVVWVADTWNTRIVRMRLK